MTVHCLNYLFFIYPRSFFPAKMKAKICKETSRGKGYLSRLLNITSISKIKVKPKQICFSPYVVICPLIQFILKHEHIHTFVSYISSVEKKNYHCPFEINIS